MKKRKIVVPLLAFLVVLALAGAGIGVHIKSTVQEIFELNQTRKSEGYYLSEFEWEMLGAAYYLDHGEYLRSFALLNKIRNKLATAETLGRLPASLDDDGKLQFYLNLQNPKTGAFIGDDSLPLFTYIGPTANMLSLIEELSAKAGKPFRLKYPLSFLDTINTPERLVVLLNDVSRVGVIGEKFKPPFVCVAELGALAESCERLGVYSFSPEWKKALFDWFYKNQDEETGLWGARSRADNQLINGGSLTESERVIKLFVDRQGNQIHPQYPLKHVDAIIASALEKLATPMPEDLDDLHEWILAKDRGIRFVTRYLWKYASEDRREAVRALIEDFVRLRFERYYVPSDGAFSLYPNADSADLDGTGEAVGMYGYLGVLDSAKQQRLWGRYDETVTSSGIKAVSRVAAEALAPLLDHPAINSVRVYEARPGDALLGAVELVFYPDPTKVADASVLLPGVRSWLETTPQVMGNWVTKESIRHTLREVKARPVPHYDGVPVDDLNELFLMTGEIALVGFDVLQVPRCMIEFKRGG